MAIRDYVYMALIALSAVIFYFHGWLAASVRHTPQKPRRPTARPVTIPELSVFVTTVSTLKVQCPERKGVAQRPIAASEPLIHCFFGNN